jgi:hypothetical protein
MLASQDGDTGRCRVLCLDSLHLNHHATLCQNAQMVIGVRVAYRKVFCWQQHLLCVHARRKMVDDTKINFNHIQTILLGFGQPATVVYLHDIHSGKHIKVSPGTGLTHWPAAQLVGSGHPVVLAAAQHQVTERIANV